MGELALSGVFTGIDSDAIINKLLTISQRPLTILQKTKSTWTARSRALDDLKSQLTSFKSILKKLHDPSTLESVTVNTADSDVLTVTGSAGATPASHQITVEQLARSERHVHAGLADKDAVLGVVASQFVYTLGIGDGAVTRTLQVGADTTLTELRDLINNDADNPGVTASILIYDDGSGLGYHLVLSGKRTGSANTITIEAATTLAGFGSADFERTQTAQDAWLKVDGYPSGEGQWIQRATNAITDVIPGLSLKLGGEGTTEVTVTQDNSSLRTTVAGLVDAYNSLLARIDAHTGYDAATKTGGVFQGDATVRSLGVQVRTALMGMARGFVSGSDPLTLAEHIGLSVDNDGLMELDTEVFNDALSDHYDDVLALIGANKSGATDSQYIQFVGTGSGTSAGVYNAEVTFDDTTGQVLSGRVRLSSNATWYDLEVDEETGKLTGPADTPVHMLTLRATWDGQAGENGVRTQSAAVRIRQGFAGLAYDRVEGMLKVKTGTLAMKQDSVQDQIDVVTKNIERMEARLVKEETRLRGKYARLEATLARFESQKGQFEALLSSLANTSSSSS